MLLSPERIIEQISKNESLPFNVPDAVREMVKHRVKSRPGKRVTVAFYGSDARFFVPIHPPRLAMEYLERAGVLFAECTRLRDRIESLQLDLFNLRQSIKGHEDEQRIHRPGVRALWKAEGDRLTAQLTTRRAASSHVKSSLEALEATHGKHGGTPAGSSSEAEWTRTLHTIDLNRIRTDAAADGSAIADLENQLTALERSTERAEARWKTEDKLHLEKVAMMGEKGQLALESRLAGALQRYASLVYDLKEYMFSAEWGLEHVFGVWDQCRWEDLDVEDLLYRETLLDGLGERLITLSDAAYGFQLLEQLYPLSFRIDLDQPSSEELTGTFRLPLPANTDLAFVRRLRVRGPVAGSVAIDLLREEPFLTRGNRAFPEWWTKPSELLPGGPSVDDVIAAKPEWDAALQRAAAFGLKDMTAPIALGHLVSQSSDAEGFAADRHVSYSSAAGLWAIRVKSPDAAAILAHGVWIDAVISRTLLP